MKAAFLVAKNTIQINEIPETQLQSSEHVLVKIDYTSICTTDLEIIHFAIPTKKLPIIIGHEAAGTVLQVGRDVKGVKTGDKVLIDPNIYDFTCATCRSGHTHLCLNGGLMGREVDGVFREIVAVHYRNLYPLPDRIPLQQAALLQPLSTVIHAHKRVKIDPGDVVLILGLGVAGLMFTQLTKLRGASVIAISSIPEKLEIAKRIGADYVLNRTETNLLDKINEISDGGVDIVIDATGVPDSVNTGFKSLKPHGTFLLFATRPGEVKLNAYDAYYKEITFYAARSSQPEDFKDSIKLVSSGKIDLGYLVSRSFSLDDIKAAVNYFEDRAKVLKVVIKVG